MTQRSTSRATSLAHQQLYKAHSESAPRCPSSVSPTRNSFSLSLMPRARSPRSSAGAHSKSSRMEDAVYVADVNPTYSVTGAVRCIAPVNDRIMWTAEYRGTLCIRALPKGTSLKELPGREDSYCCSLLYLPTEDVVWAGFQDGYLHVYNAKSMVLLKEVMAHNGGLNCMVEVDGTVITGGANWKMCQWDPTNGSAHLQRTLYGHNGGVRALCVYDGPTGAVVFSGSDDGTVRAWDPYDFSAGQGTTDASIHTFTGHCRAVLALAVVSQANQLWSAGEDMTLRVWDMRSLSCLKVLRGCHTAPISCVMVVESRVWSADKHGHILVWDIATQSPLQDLAERVPYWGLGQGMVLSMQKVQLTSAYKVWTASSSGVLQCWNAETVPIIFDDVPVSTGVLRNPSTGAATPRGIATRSRNGAAAAAAAPAGGSPVDAVGTSALTVASVNYNWDTQSSFNEDNLPVLAPMAQMKEYIRSLEEKLEATKRDAKLNYEKYRTEAQCEIETQQLLAQENDRLRERVRELEMHAGEAHEEMSQPARVSTGAASSHAADAEVERLRSLLMDMQRQLDEALLRQRELEAELNQREFNSSFTNVLDAAEAPTAAGRKGGNNEFSSAPHSAALSGKVNDTSNLYSAMIFASGHGDRDSGIQDGMPVKHTCLYRRFQGGNWEYIIEEKPHELRSTFIADLCAGLGVAPTQLKRVDLRLGTLIAEVEVVHPASVPAAELERRMQTYRFPALMRLHMEAFTAPKTVPDTAAATIDDLQKRLAVAQQRERMESSPEPQEPASSSNSASSEVKLSFSEWQRIKDQNDALSDAVQRQTQLIDDLKNEMAEKEAQLADAREQLEDVEVRLQEPASSSNSASSEVKLSFSEWQRIKDQNDALSDAVQRQTQLIDDLKNEMAEKEAQLADARAQLEDVEVRLQEAASSSNSASSEVKLSFSEWQRIKDQNDALSDAVQRQTQLIDDLKNEMAEKEAQLADAREQLEDVEVRLQEPASSSNSASSEVKLSFSEWQRIKDQNDALSDAVQRQTQLIDDLKNEMAEKEAQLADARAQLEDVEVRLQEAASSSNSASSEVKLSFSEWQRIKDQNDALSDAVQRQTQLIDDLKNEMAEKEAQLADARAQLEDVEVRLQEPASSSNSASSEVKLSFSEWQRIKGQNDALSDAVQRQTQLIDDLKNEVAEKEAQLADARAQLEDVEVRLQEAASSSNSASSEVKLSFSEWQRIKDQNDALSDAVQRQTQLIDDLKNEVAEKEAQLADARAQLEDVEVRLQEAASSSNSASSEVKLSFSEWQRIKDQNDALSDAVQRQTQLIDDLKNEMAEKEAQLADARAQLEDVEVRLQEAASSSNSASSEVKLSFSEWQRIKDQNDALSDAVQRQTQLIDDLKNEVAEKEAQLADARAQLEDVEVRLQEAASSSNSASSEVKLSFSEWQRIKDQNDALSDAVQRQTQLIDDLKNEMAEKEAQLADARAQLEDVEVRLQEAEQQRQDTRPTEPRQLSSDSSEAHAEDSVREPPCLDCTARKEEDSELGRAQVSPVASGAGDEDHEALKRYLHDQLKPMISRLMRARGELQFDNEKLKKKVKELTAQVHQQQQVLEAERERALISVEAPAPLAVTSSAPDEEVQRLREDHEALNKYLHEHLKPMVSRLKRAQGEMEVDLSRAREDLRRACDMYEGAAAALEEEHVREEKMGEAMEALQKALEAEQVKNQVANREATAACAWHDIHAANPPTRCNFETPSVCSTEPTQSRRSADRASGAVEPPCGDAEKDALDKLVALNLDLSIRLADAETVIVQLQDSLACSSRQLAEQRDETHRLLTKIQQYQQSRPRSPDPNTADRYSSIDNVVSSPSPSKSPSRNPR
ncbi:hypothetical protein CUR178_06283 [Leishmania enriettii]|uniref:Flagellar attachment zone protein 1 conserved domain-containing protein n=1 Tax=Leishmania enriettii TaxID=5663 RepID=A0A836H642_LEIEN|nr:hypothetical protein CUR178_06283 [Leishmania enriettii]